MVAATTNADYRLVNTGDLFVVSVSSSVRIEVVMEKELAKFMVSVWYAYCEDEKAEWLQDIVSASPLFEEHTITQDEIDIGEYDNDYEEGQVVYVLSALGEQARDSIDDC